MLTKICTYHFFTTWTNKNFEELHKISEFSFHLKKREKGELREKRWREERRREKSEEKKGKGKKGKERKGEEKKDAYENPHKPIKIRSFFHWTETLFTQWTLKYNLKHWFNSSHKCLSN